MAGPGPARHEALALRALDVLDAERAERHLDDLEAVARDIGAEPLLAVVLLLRARSAIVSGDDVRALALAEQAEAAQHRIGGRARVGECLMLRALLLAKAGDAAAARELLERAIEIYDDLDVAVEARACRLLLADVWRTEGRLDRALPLVEAELPFLDELGALEPAQSPLCARMAGWRVLATAGDARATRQLELAMAELERHAGRAADPAVRRRILERLPLHKEIVAEWHEHLGPAPQAIADRP
jgi:tetratricopeptide (TPR) repeat protein